MTGCGSVCVCGGGGGGGRFSQKKIGFLSNAGLNNLKNQKTTKPAFIDRSSSGNASEMPFKWHFAGGQMMARFVGPDLDPNCLKM